MQLNKRRYIITDWKGCEHRLTAEELYERVKADSSSNYNWIASATELVKTCQYYNFPKTYAVKIEGLILNCFAALELQKEVPSYSTPDDNEAVIFCYKHLANSEDSDAQPARLNYLKNVIAGIAKYYDYGFRAHPGDEYRKFCQEWVFGKTAEYALETSIDFEQLRKSLKSDFEAAVKHEEQAGTFEKSDAEYRKRISELTASMAKDFT